ncbi:MAG: glycosyltransferase family 4 protein [Gallionella sp.]|jgi:rhamnosyl/mannosyltransferase
MKNEPIRVLHFFKVYYPDSFGGIEQVIFQLCKGGAAHGYQGEVLALSHDTHETPIEFSGHLVYQAKLDLQIASTGFSFSALNKFRQLADTADVIHFHFPWPFMDMIHFLSGHGKPTILTYHSDIIRQTTLLKLYRPLMNRFLSSVDRIVATSPNYLATSEVLKNYLNKVVDIPYGLDKTTYPSPSAALLNAWRMKFGSRFFLFVGMLRYYKGLHILLAAMQGVDFPVVIMGSGPMEAELKSQASGLGLKNVHFLGALSDEDKVALLTLSYAVVFPSHLRSEAFGISLLEGAMYGKPLISSEIGTGTTFVNIANETGLVVPPGDPKALRQAMEKLWHHPELAREMGVRAEKRYWQLFTAERMAASYAHVYAELAGRPTPGKTI